MRFKDVFSIIGPAMVGPSSSHTAGAVRLGRVARRLLGGRPERVRIELFGSFADTYRGHGTDLALVGGLLDYDTDDLGIRTSLAEASRSGMEVLFAAAAVPAVHPNTAKLEVTGNGRSFLVTGASIGGGNIEIFSVNDFDVRFSASLPTLLVFHADRSGMIAELSKRLSEAGVNIARMGVDRKNRSGEALSVFETDGSVSYSLLGLLKELPNVREVILIDLEGRGSLCDSAP
jgi:L-serine dehydratase